MTFLLLQNFLQMVLITMIFMPVGLIPTIQISGQRSGIQQQVTPIAILTTKAQQATFVNTAGQQPPQQ